MKKVTRTLALLLTLCTLLSCMSIFVSADSSLGNISTEQMIIPPNAEEAAAAVAAADYSISPVYLLPFIFNGTNPSLVSDVDISGCVEGLLYVYNSNYDTVTKIGDSGVVEFTSTKDHLFYVTTDRKIFQTDYTGSFHTQMYQFDQGSITNLEYYNGKLYFIENGIQVVVLDVATRAAVTVFANKDLRSVFFFDDDKFIWRNSNDEAFYYNITSKGTVAFNNEHEVNCVVAPYITPVYSDEQVAEIAYAGNSVNDITFPISPYIAAMNSYSNGYPTPATYFRDGDVSVKLCNHDLNDSEDCKRYASTNQCDGFAVFAYEQYVHYANEKWGTPLFKNTQDRAWYHDGDTHDANDENNDGISDSRWSETKFRSYIQSLEIGSFIRFGKDDGFGEVCGEQHSVVVTGFNSTGVWFYECNNDNACGVFHTYYTYGQLAQKYHCIWYLAEHSFDKAPESAASLTGVDASKRHIVGCSNCSGYLLPKHTSSSKTSYSSSKHKVTYTCCGYVAYEAHDESSLYLHPLSSTTHQTIYGCCGYVKSSVTHTRVMHHIYSETKHKVTTTCCNFLSYEDHVYSGTYPECLKCGYSPELGILKAEEPQE